MLHNEVSTVQVCIHCEQNLNLRSSLCHFTAEQHVQFGDLRCNHFFKQIQSFSYSRSGHREPTFFTNGTMVTHHQREAQSTVNVCMCDLYTLQLLTQLDSQIQPLVMVTYMT